MPKRFCKAAARAFAMAWVRMRWETTAPPAATAAKATQGRTRSQPVRGALETAVTSRKLPAAAARKRRKTSRDGQALMLTLGGWAAPCRACWGVSPAKGLSLTACSARRTAFMASSRTSRALLSCRRTASRFTSAPRSRAMASFSGRRSASAWERRTARAASRSSACARRASRPLRCWMAA